MTIDLKWSAVAVVLLCCGIGAAFAAGGTSSSQSLAAGSESVAVCDVAPSWSYSFGKNTNGQVSSVVITNIASTCSGGSMQVTLAGPVLASNGTPTAISACAGTCSVTVPFLSGLLFPSQITAANALIVGP